MTQSLASSKEQSKQNSECSSHQLTHHNRPSYCLFANLSWTNNISPPPLPTSIPSMNEMVHPRIVISGHRRGQHFHACRRSRSRSRSRMDLMLLLLLPSRKSIVPEIPPFFSSSKNKTAM